jgi:hypothetical protein
MSMNIHQYFFVLFNISRSIFLLRRRMERDWSMTMEFCVSPFTAEQNLLAITDENHMKECQ